MSKTLFLSAIGILLIAGCTGDRKESPTRGWAHVVTSESIEPIVTREIEMFVDLYKDAHVTNRALPARSAVVEFFNVDSIKALITSRPLNEEEIAIANRTGLKYEEYRIALDAVAVIVHRSNGLSFLRTTLLDSIFTGLLPRGGVWLEPGQEAWATVLVRGRLRKTIDLYIPDNLWRQGVSELRDILKLIVSTDEVDATLLQQGELPVTFAPTFRKMPKRLSTLNRLMARVHTRDFGAAVGNEEAFADWTTVEVASTVVRPAEAVV